MQFDELVSHSVDVFDDEIVAALSSRYPIRYRELSAVDVAEFVYLAALTPTVADLDAMHADLRNGAHAAPTEHGDPLSEDVIQAMTYLLEDWTRPLRAINSIDFDSGMRMAMIELRNDDRVTYATQHSPMTRMASRPLRVYSTWFYTIASRIAGKTIDNA